MGLPVDIRPGPETSEPRPVTAMARCLSLIRQHPTIDYPIPSGDGHMTLSLPSFSNVGVEKEETGKKVVLA